MEFLIRKAKTTDMSKVLDLIVELAIFEKEPLAVEISVGDLIQHGTALDVNNSLICSKIIVILVKFKMKFELYFPIFGAYNFHQK